MCMATFIAVYLHHTTRYDIQREPAAKIMGEAARAWHCTVKLHLKVFTMQCRVKMCSLFYANSASLCMFVCDL